MYIVRQFPAFDEQADNSNLTFRWLAILIIRSLRTTSALHVSLHYSYKQPLITLHFSPYTDMQVCTGTWYIYEQSYHHPHSESP